MNIYQNLLNAGAEEETVLSFFREREKVSGAMWNGEATLRYKNLILRFRMWHHKHEEEDMTTEEAISHLYLQSMSKLDLPDKAEFKGNQSEGRNESTIIETSNLFSQSIKSYDLYWNGFQTDTRLYVSEIGWPNDYDLKKFVEGLRRQYDSSDKISEETHKALIDNGFECLIQLD